MPRDPGRKRRCQSRSGSRLRGVEARAELDEAAIVLGADIAGQPPVGDAVLRDEIKEAHTFFANHKAWLFVRKRVHFAHAHHIVQ